MRVLVNHVIGMPEVREGRALPGRRPFCRSCRQCCECANRCESCGAQVADEIIAWGHYYPGTPSDPGMDWEEMLARCPSGWRPDVYIHWSPEYNALPNGIERADCLTVGVWGDWNLGGQAIRAMGDVFDMQFADRNGGDILRRMGFDNVHYAPLWAFDPKLHRRLPNITRDIDVLMIGNFNHGIQSERAKWLARVARLSSRYNVVLTAGVYGDDYTRLMNRAKIVFNRSIRGETNMRAYEAPACGTLLFYEAENREIRDVYTDREHCVLYDDSNLESLLDYYLAPEHAAEREQIASSGWQQVQTHDYSHHFANLLNQVEARLTEDVARNRGFLRHAPEVQAERRATQWLLSTNRPALERILPNPPTPLPNSLRREGGEAMETPAFSSVPDSFAARRGNGEKVEASEADLADAQVSNSAPPPSLARNERAGKGAGGLGPVILGELSRFSEAVDLAEQELRADPDQVLTRCNLGFLHLANGNIAAGLATLEDVTERLTAPDLRNAQLVGLVYPRRFDGFLAAWERIWAEHAPGSDDWREKIRTLLLAHVSLTLAVIYFANLRYREAAKAAKAATEAWPESGETNLMQARAMRAWGRADDAVDAYRQTIQAAPFQHEAWNELARILLDLQRAGEALALLNDWAALLRACPIYDGLRPHCETLRREALALARQPFAPPVSITRLIGFPDWRDSQSWQPLVSTFAERYAPTDPVVLMLRADPKTAPEGQTLLASLAAFLTQNLRLSSSALPNITLLNQPLAPDEEWKLFHVADALLTVSPLSESLADFASAACLPVMDLGVRGQGPGIKNPASKCPALS